MQKRSEASEQAAVIQWARLMSRRKGYEPLALLHHIPNGGSRHPAEAAHLKAQGTLSGIPDLCLPVPSGPYHALYIEMKYGKNRLTENQKERISQLRAFGNAVAVCYSAQEAIDVISRYISAKNPDAQ